MTLVGRMNRTRNSVGRTNTRRVAVDSFLPTDIADCIIWLDFSDAATLFLDDGVTPVSANNDPIQQASDKSTVGNHARAALVSLRPLYKLNQKNNLSAAYYDGGAALRHITDLDMQNTTLIIAGNFTIDGDIRGLHARATYALFCVDDNISAGRTTASFISVPVVSNTDAIVVATLPSSGNGIIRLNGGVQSAAGATSTWGGTFRTELFGDGVGSYGIGYSYEFIRYSRILTQSEYEQLEVYLNTKWAIY